MTTTPDAPAGIDLTDEAFWERPPEERETAFARLRAEAPFAFFGEPLVPYIEPGPGYYAVVRHADVEAISRDSEAFCSGRGAVSIPDLPEDLVQFYGSMISMDDPRHAKIRRIVSRAFTPRRLESLLDDVEAIAHDTAGALRRELEAHGEADFVEHFAAPLPLRVICQMMGIADEHLPLVLEKSNLILSGGDPEIMGVDEDAALGLFLEAGQALSDLMSELADERRARPTDDLTSALVQSIDGESLTPQEIGSFFILLCVAGNETTRNAVSEGLVALSTHPEQRARWAGDRSLDKTAVEEIVRWASPVRWMRRTATREVEVGGKVFAEGDKVLLFYSSANRDERAFDDPASFDLTRTKNPHYGFGAPGPHFCLGANLARREIAVAFHTLFDQLGDLELAGEPDRLRSSFVNGIKRLPVRLG